ncbi:MAG: hypothetical protein NC203_01325 [Firmicutes bacterium]|nr:hypothetical protein [[Eubacterium] siraeum]MCM1486982.1 hypothetical protein [Bacillota bacterium]
MNHLKKTLSIAWFGIKNNRVLAGIMLLACVIILPGFTVIEDNHYDMANTVRDYGICIAYFCGVVIPLVLYSYVQKRRECDFYNSMPVKRSQYFWGYFISGFALFLVPFTLLTLLHVLLSGMGENVFEHFLPVVGIFTVIYCSTITAVMFSGSVLSTLVTIVLRNTAPVAAVMLPVIMAGANLDCYLLRLGDKICILTPLTAAAVCFDENSIILWQLVIALPELLIGFLMHRFRKSETTTALAFPRVRYVYQYVVLLITAFLTDALLLSMFGSGYIYSRSREYNNIFQYLEPEAIALCIFFTVIAVFLAFIIMNMILDRSGSAAFKKFRHFFIFLAGYAGLLALLFTTLLNRLPPYILSFEPNCAIVHLDEYRQATEEEKALINSGEWDRHNNGSFIYGSGENEIYISCGTSFNYFVSRKENLNTLEYAAKWGEADGINLGKGYNFSVSTFGGAAKISQVDVLFCRIPDKEAVKNGATAELVQNQIDRQEIRWGYSDNTDFILQLTDFPLE